jgi:hypothetical protein
MRKLTLLIFVVLCQRANAAEGDKKPHELNQWNPLPASYKIHSGGTAYSELPTKTDSAFSVAFKDEAARQVFEQIGPDVPSSCSDEKGYRVREKKGVYCSYTPRLENPKNSHYRCWIGINLRTGEGDVRVSC